MEDAPAPARLLLVEGVDDKHVVRHVARWLGRLFG